MLSFEINKRFTYSKWSFEYPVRKRVLATCTFVKRITYCRAKKILMHRPMYILTSLGGSCGVFGGVAED